MRSGESHGSALLNRGEVAVTLTSWLLCYSPVVPGILLKSAWVCQSGQTYFAKSANTEKVRYACLFVQPLWK